MTGLTAQLAARIAGLRAAGIPPSVMERAAQSFTDWTAVTAATSEALLASIVAGVEVGARDWPLGKAGCTRLLTALTALPEVNAVT